MMEEIVVYTLDEFKRLKLSGASIGFMMQCTTLISLCIKDLPRKFERCSTINYVKKNRAATLGAALTSLFLLSSSSLSWSFPNEAQTLLSAPVKSSTLSTCVAT
jgi:hypothetical protein